MADKKQHSLPPTHETAQTRQIARNHCVGKEWAVAGGLNQLESTTKLPVVLTRGASKKMVLCSLFCFAALVLLALLVCEALSAFCFLFLTEASYAHILRHINSFLLFLLDAFSSRFFNTNVLFLYTLFSSTYIFHVSSSFCFFC